MHAGSTIRRFQTANYLFVEVGKNYVIGWSTFSPHPCISLFKPIFLMPDPVGILYDDSYWSKVKNLHRDLENKSPEQYKNIMDFTLNTQT